MNINLSKTKLFTILISIFYAFGLSAYFFHQEKFFAFIILIVASCLIYFFNFGIKKSIILFFIFFLGILRAYNSSNLETILDGININNATITGQIITPKDILIEKEKIRFFINAKEFQTNETKVENLNTKILVSINSIENEKDIHIGDYIELKGKLRTPTKAKNPFQFDYEQYLLNNNCKNILYADSFKIVKSPTSKEDLWFYTLRQFENKRNSILERHSKNIKSPNIEIFGGIIFGNETINPDEKIKEDFKNSGLLHLLAASGLNVALIFGIWWWIASFLKLPYNFSILSGAIFVILYTFMTGFPPSILRASLMLLFVLFGKIIDRSANSVALLFFVGFLMLLATPKMIFDIGFQLSFAVTFGLIVCCPIIIDKFNKKDEKFIEKYSHLPRFAKFFIYLFSPKSLVSIICVPLIAQLWVIPLQMHYFNNLAPLSLFANIAVVPFIGILSFIGFISSIIALIPKFTSTIIFIFDSIANPLLTLLIKISEIFSSFDFSLISTIGLNSFQIFMIWILILLLCLNIKNNFINKKEKIYLLVCVILLFLSFIKLENFSRNLEIMMFDVENADSFLIKTPKNKYIMIDTGKKAYKSTSSAEIIINRYLKNKKIKNIETLIITHFDMDHCGGTIDILKNFKVKNIIIQKEDPKSLLANEIIDYLKEKNLNYKIATNKEEIYKEKDLLITIYKNNLKNDNESSIATLVNYKNQNLLFMADMGIKGYDEIKNNLPNKIEILKVGHHGAKNTLSNEMLAQLKPSYALISTGINTFNHPHFTTIQLLDDRKIKTISSKNYGFSKIVIKNSDISFYHYNSTDKKLKRIIFNKGNNLPFHKTIFTQNLIKNAL